MSKPSRDFRHLFCGFVLICARNCHHRCKITQRLYYRGTFAPKRQGKKLEYSCLPNFTVEISREFFLVVFKLSEFLSSRSYAIIQNIIYMSTSVFVVSFVASVYLVLYKLHYVY